MTVSLAVLARANGNSNRENDILLSVLERANGFCTILINQRFQTCLLESEEKKAKQGALVKRKDGKKNKDLNKDGKQDSEDGEYKKHKDASKREDYVFDDLRGVYHQLRFYDEQGRQRAYYRNCKKRKIINR